MVCAYAASEDIHLRMLGQQTYKLAIRGVRWYNQAIYHFSDRFATADPWISNGCFRYFGILGGVSMGLVYIDTLNRVRKKDSHEFGGVSMIGNSLCTSLIFISLERKLVDSKKTSKMNAKDSSKSFQAMIGPNEL